MRFYRFATTLALLLAPILGGSLQGCSTPGVGDPCLPEQIPATGFNDSEAYIESSSVQCQTRVCMVYHLSGDPREGCTPASQVTPCAAGDKTCVEPPTCADAKTTESHVYCTCRCDTGNTGFAACKCPTEDGFECKPILEQGGPGVRGSYCVRKGT